MPIRISKQIMQAIDELTREMEEQAAEEAMDNVADYSARVLVETQRRAGIRPSIETGTIRLQSKKARRRSKRYGSITDIKKRVVKLADKTISLSGSPNDTSWRVPFAEFGTSKHVLWKKKTVTGLPPRPFVAPAQAIVNRNAPKIIERVLVKYINSAKSTTINKRVG